MVLPLKKLEKNIQVYIKNGDHKIKIRSELATIQVFPRISHFLFQPQSFLTRLFVIYGYRSTYAYTCVRTYVPAGSTGYSTIICTHIKCENWNLHEMK